MHGKIDSIHDYFREWHFLINISRIRIHFREWYFLINIAKIGLKFIFVTTLIWHNRRKEEADTEFSSECKSLLKSVKFVNDETCKHWLDHFRDWHFLINSCRIRIKSNFKQHLPGVKEEGNPGFSYQNRSPFRKRLNWLARMHAKVGPTMAPSMIRSETPADHRSMSSGCLHRKR